jgi:hypothetical protein
MTVHSGTTDGVESRDGVVWSGGPWVVTTRIEFEDAYRAAAFERYLKSPSGRAFARKHFAVDAR